VDDEIGADIKVLSAGEGPVGLASASGRLSPQDGCALIGGNPLRAPHDRRLWSDVVASEGKVPFYLLAEPAKTVPGSV
jgi:hypothetical protein